MGIGLPDTHRDCAASYHGSITARCTALPGRTTIFRSGLSYRTLERRSGEEFQVQNPIGTREGAQHHQKQTLYQHKMQQHSPPGQHPHEPENGPLALASSVPCKDELALYSVDAAVNPGILLPYIEEPLP